MPVVSFPGVYWVEEGGIPVVSAASPDIGGFEGRFKRGLTTDIGFATSWEQFETLYGAYQYSTGSTSELYGPHCVKQFFDNGGGGCWINRVTNTGDSSAAYAPATADGTAAFAAISTVGAGEGGNDLSIGFTKQSTTLAVQWLFGDIIVTLTSAQGFEVGDIIVAGANQAMIQTINYTTNVCGIIAVGGAAPAVLVDTAAYTTSTHRVSTTLALPVLALATTITLTDASRVTTGMILSINDITNSEQLTVASVAGNVVTVSALVNGFAATDPVISQEFDLRVFENGILRETHPYLSVSATSADYSTTRLTGDDNESVFITCTDGAGSDTADYNFCPINTGLTSADAVALSGAVDAAVPTDAEFVGTAGSGAKTGLNLFDNASRINFFSVTDSGTLTVDQGANTYAAARQDTEYIAHTYFDDISMIEMYNTRKATALDSSFTALYGPWYSVADPDINGHTLSIPPDGGVQGLISYATRTRGVHKAPANDAALNGVQGLLVNLTEIEQGYLNPEGINVIRDFTGNNRGYRVYGARTLWSVEDGYHYLNVRRLVTHIRSAVIEDMQWAVFEPNNAATRSALTRSLRPFLKGFYDNGALTTYSGTIEGENGAYYVQCDNNNNPASEAQAGKLNVKIGIQPTYPAEFVVFTLGFINGVLQS